MISGKTNNPSTIEDQAIQRLERLSLGSIDSLNRLRKVKIAETLKRMRRKAFSKTVFKAQDSLPEIFCCEELYFHNKDENNQVPLDLLQSALTFFVKLEKKLTCEHRAIRDKHVKTVEVVQEFREMLTDNPPKHLSKSDKLYNLLRGKETSQARANPNREDFLFNWIRDNLSYMRLTSMRGLWLAFNTKFPSLRVSYDFFRKFMMGFYSFKYSKVSLKSRYLLQKQSQWSRINLFLKLQEAISKDYTIVFLDESYFRRVHCKVKNWYSDKFDSSVTHHMDLIRDTVTLTLAVTREGMTFHKFNRETNTVETFLSFIQDLTDHLKKQGIQRFYLFMDNVNLHKTNKVLSFLQKNQLNVIYSAKYSCEFNLCEYLFSNLKIRHYNRVCLDA